MGLELRLGFINFHAKRSKSGSDHSDEVRIEALVDSSPSGDERYVCEVSGTTGWPEMVALLVDAGFEFGAEISLASPFQGTDEYYVIRPLAATNRLAALAEMRALLTGSGATEVEPTAWWYVDVAGKERGISIVERSDGDKLYLDVTPMAKCFTEESAAGCIEALRAAAELWHDTVTFAPNRITVQLRSRDPMDVMAALEGIAAIYG